MPRADDPDAAGGVVYATIAAFLFLVAAAIGGFYFINNPSAWGRLKGNLSRYFGADGLVWREGLKNMTLLGKTTVLWVKNLLVYLFLLLQIISALFREIRRRLT